MALRGTRRWRASHAKAYQKHAAALGRTPLPDDELTLLRERYDEVLDRWGGKSLSRPLGWASPICSNPGIADLEQRAGVAHLRPFYRYGNHAIHAGPRAAAIQRIAIDGEPHRTPGATVYTDFAETGHGAISLLQMVNAALVSERTRGDGIETESVVAHGSLNELVNRCGDAFVAAADLARDRGWFLHSPDD